VKHGALAGDQVEVNWQVREGQGDPRLLLNWRESGTGAVAEPAPAASDLN
jgi:two-component sensor histidine kinase